MTETLTRVIKDCTTGEETIVPLTAVEIAEREQMSKAYLEEQARLKAEAEQLAALKASADAKLTALYESAGLTPEEIAAKLA